VLVPPLRVIEGQSGAGVRVLYAPGRLDRMAALAGLAGRVSVSQPSMAAYGEGAGLGHLTAACRVPGCKSAPYSLPYEPGSG
jgi:hypothetical protein